MGGGTKLERAQRSHTYHCPHVRIRRLGLSSLDEEESIQSGGGTRTALETNKPPRQDTTCQDTRKQDRTEKDRTAKGDSNQIIYQTFTYISTAQHRTLHKSSIENISTTGFARKTTVQLQLYHSIYTIHIPQNNQHKLQTKR